MKKNQVLILDETLLPNRVHYIKAKNSKAVVKAVKDMKTRAFGQVLAFFNGALLTLEQNKNKINLENILKTAMSDFCNARPTLPFGAFSHLVNCWIEKAKEKNLDLYSFIKKNILGFLENTKNIALKRAQEVSQILQDNDTILTHCNISGQLVMIAQIARTQGKKINFFVTETRPYFQGSRLTAWELKKAGFEVTLICDNMIAKVMSEGKIDKVIVGSDHSAENGDIANKIGTYQLAVCAKEFNIPFYCLTQSLGKLPKTGSDIKIEIRPEKEFLFYQGKRFAPLGTHAYYPGFDITPSDLITKRFSFSV
ncbi:MAG: S-methyl-5-thioribose-1-phosphate isomerase [Candidatus Omnitrophota bacterium]